MTCEAKVTAEVGVSLAHACAAVESFPVDDEITESENDVVEYVTLVKSQLVAPKSTRSC